MNIAKWILEAAGNEEVSEGGFVTESGKEVNFQDPTYNELRKKYAEGTLKDIEAEALEQIEYLIDVINVSTAKLLDSLNQPVKEAAPKKEEAPEAPAAEKVPPALPSGRQPEVSPAAPAKRDGEPQITKWKESRYNERLKQWQAIVTQRKVVNFDTELQSIEFLKKI
jgi:hypothetical protein